jgi:hypothetical protein
MDDDRELLAKAANAAGYPLGVSGDGFFIAGAHPLKLWNPLEDDGDALRLLVKLGLSLETEPDTSFAHPYEKEWEGQEVAHLSDPHGATRRAIVLAAAAMLATGEQP